MISEPDYDTVCRYLRLQPRAELYSKIRACLTAMPSPPTDAFGEYLAERRPGAFELGLLDVWSRLFSPTHAWRFRLNAVVAVYECDAAGYAALRDGEYGPVRTWCRIAAACATFALTVPVAVAWVGALRITHRLRLTRQGPCVATSKDEPSS